jgi:hypothetical protein
MNRNLLNGGAPFVGSLLPQLQIADMNLRSLISTGQVRRILRGVYVDIRAEDTRELRAAALHLIKPDRAVFYGATVAFLLGVDVFPPKEQRNFRPQCVVPHGAGRSRQEDVRCREGYLPDDDLMTLSGLVVTTPVRATADMLRSLWRPHAMAAADAMAHAGLVTPEEVMAYIRPMKRYPGIVQARALASLIEPLAESPGESWQRLRLVDAGLPVPGAQLEVSDRFGRIVARLDNDYEKAKVGIDYDGREFHDDDDAKEYDESKRTFLRDVLGWKISVAPYERAFGSDTKFEDEIAEWLSMKARPRWW